MGRIVTVAAGIVALLFIVFRIAVPNYLYARDRTSQKRTMADMRTIATAWEARASDTKSYSVGGPHAVEGRVTVEELARSLEPTYVRKLPRVDGWGTEFVLVTADDDRTDGAQAYFIRSLASDRRPDRIANLTGSTTDFRDDVIYSNGSFIRYPEDAG